MSFTEIRHDPVVFLAAPELNCGAAVHGFSTRIGGVSRPPRDTLDLRASSADTPEVRENFRRFCAAVGADYDRMVFSKQVHRDDVRLVTGADAGTGIFRERDYEADGLITNEPGLPLVIFSADCIPVLLHDPVRHAIGACHAGWRGTALGIAAKTVRRMTEEFGTDPADLRCAIGPGISRCCFETDGDVPQAMLAALGDKACDFIDDHGTGKYHVDLKGINHRWLASAGVKSENIAVSDECTVCFPHRYFSHRVLGAERGSMAAIIQLV